MARLSTRTSSVQAQSFPAPEEIGQAILDNPDLLRELAIGHARVAREKSEHKQQKQTRSRLANTTSRSSRQFISMPNSARQENLASGFKDSTCTSELSPWGGSPRAVSEALPGTPLQRSIQKSEPLSFVTASPRLKTLAMEEQQHVVQECGTIDVNQISETGVQSARFKKKEMQDRVYKRKKRKNSKPQKYTLTKFMHEVEEKEKHHREIDFSVKEHALWHMTVSQSVVKSAFSEDVKYYRSKFQAWARGVISREKQLLGFSVYDNSQGSPSFTPGAGEGIQKLDQESGSQFKNNKKQGTMILDIGALSAGDYFGEDYRKEEQIYKQYLKNCRWERFKKKVLDDVFEAKAFRTYMRVGLKAMHYIPEEDGPKGPKPTLSEWK
ncbi:hypothetical protein R1sor_024486 [Riccia sorocarpa]|uniref:Uncharacterized protein n=1 Tax=Riccia sorocarpa TaxID=122646 RepID=A0ABD3GTU7_9MARC